MNDSPAAASSWKQWHAFGLPGGSVRALLALALASTLCCALALNPEQQIPYYLQNVMFIVLGHYFAARKAEAPEAAGGPPPLWLPKGSIRVVLVLGFAAVGVLLFRQERLLEVGKNPGVLSLYLVLGFLLGVVVTRIVHIGKPRPRRLLEDARAALSLVAVGVLVFMVAGEQHWLPSGGSAAELHARLAGWRVQYVSAALVSFYFGSRS